MRVAGMLMIALALPVAAETADGALAQSRQEVIIEAGDFAEPCFRMAKADRLEYSFGSDQPLDFNIHYHLGNEVFFPVREKNLLRHEHVYIATGSRTYCLMWTNRGDRPASLRYNYTQHRGVGVN